ncbi:preprotein translocase subunit YajC [Salinimicrobium xinjiangense]|uniref:preprotein translocase subunit YajC n=1 Tax=Salinimicrobium xinjiangense TaxID=438596 RepID=UPI00041F7A44|nr:preprotein translocase subunit YajC [Salinimicrobium xinjiangense]
MGEFWTNEIFLYLALLCVGVSFFLWIRSRKRRKKELEWRRSLSDRIRSKMSRKKSSGSAEMNFGD